MKVNRITMTPQKAAELLATVDPAKQRRLSRRRVGKYARDMAAGEWRDQGDVFRVDTTGALIDGQHRAAAVVESDTEIPFPVLLLSEIDPASIHVIDRGGARSMRDICGLRGYSGNAARAGELARLRLSLDGLPNPSDAELLAMIERHPEYLTVCVDLLPAHRRAFSASIRLALAEMYARSADKAAAFAQRLATCETGPGDPAAALLRLMTASTKQDRVTMYHKAVAAMIADLAGAKLTKVYARDWPTKAVSND